MTTLMRSIQVCFCVCVCFCFCVDFWEFFFTKNYHVFNFFFFCVYFVCDLAFIISDSATQLFLKKILFVFFFFWICYCVLVFIVSRVMWPFNIFIHVGWFIFLCSILTLCPVIHDMTNNCYNNTKSNTLIFYTQTRL